MDDIIEKRNKNETAAGISGVMSVVVVDHLATVSLNRKIVSLFIEKKCYDKYLRSFLLYGPKLPSY